jgi:hypothetical protein
VYDVSENTADVLISHPAILLSLSHFLHIFGHLIPYTLYRIPYSQRSWGVPIPVFYKKSTNEALMNTEILDHVEGAVQSLSGVM